jgi:hypothetical protein
VNHIEYDCSCEWELPQVSKEHMKLKEIQEKYAFIAIISKSNSSYGNYAVRLKMPVNHIEFFFRLSDMVRFLDSHVKDLRSGNCL